MHVFENESIYGPKVLDITDDDLIGSFSAALNNVTSIALETNIPTLSSIPHSIINGYKKVLAVSVATDYTFPLAEKVKEMIANPEAFAAAAPAAAAETKEEVKE